MRATFMWGALCLTILGVCVAVQLSLRGEGEGARTITSGDNHVSELRDESGATTPAPAATTRTLTPDSPVTWQTTWDAARDAARRTGRLVLLYVGLDPQTCPPCKHLERRVFEQPETDALNRLTVPLYIRQDATTTEAEQRFLQRLKPGPLPMLALLTAEGGVVHRQGAGLYGTYSGDYRKQSSAPEGLLTAPQLLALVQGAARRAVAVTARMDALARQDTASARFELAGHFADRERFGDAVECLRTSLRSQDDGPTRARLAEILVQAGRRTEARTHYERLIADHVDDPEHLRWQLALTVLRAHTASDAEALRAGQLDLAFAEIIALAEHARRRDIEAVARAELAALERRLEHSVELENQLAWFAREYLGTNDHSLSAEVRWEVAHLAHEAGRRKEAVAHLRRLQQEHPRSDEAQLLKHGLLDMWSAGVTPGSG